MFDLKAENYTFAAGTGAVTPAMPSGWAADDILILIVESAAAEAVTAPSGYTEAPGSPQVGADTRLTVFWRRAVAGDAAPTIADPGDHVGAALVALSGAIKTGNPFTASAGAVAAAGSTAVNFPAVTPGVGNGIINAVASGADTITRPLSSITMPDTDSTTREGVWVSTTNGNGGGADMYFAVATGSGSISSTGVMSNTGAKAMLSLVVAPEPDTTDRVYNMQVITPVTELGIDAAAVFNAQVVTVVDQMGFNVVMNSLQLITVVVEPQVISRRRGFMSSVP